MAHDTAARIGKQFETIERFRNARPVTGTMHEIYMKGTPPPARALIHRYPGAPDQLRDCRPTGPVQ